MHENTSVTVVIPAFNAALTIATPIESLLRQTHAPDEILVIDDGSADNLATALLPYRHRVTLIRKSNGGVASARNLGIENATGQWIAFLDADDHWEPQKLERQLEILRRHPHVRLVSTRWFDQVANQPRELANIGSNDDSRFYESAVNATGEDIFRVAMLLWTSTVLVHRDELCDLRFESGLEPAEDRDMWVRLVSRCPVYLLPEPLATYIQEPGSLSRSNIDRDCRNMLRVIRRYAHLLGDRGLKEWEANLFRRWAGAHLSFGRPASALRPACKRVQYHPTSVEAWWVFFKSAGAVAAGLPRSLLSA
jgi:glycosyltransferase involved in cell wall biosynthesis